MDQNPTSARSSSATDDTTPPISPLQACNTFHPFTRLPYELQVQIWTIIPITARCITLKHKFGFPQKFLYYRLSSSSIPALLHTCSLSRQIALKTYQLTFCSIALRPIYFSPAHDTLCLNDLLNNWSLKKARQPDPRFEFGISDADLAAIQHVIISHASSSGAQWVSDGIETQLRGMTDLRSVGLVYEDFRYGHELRIGRALVGLKGRLRDVVGVKIVGDGVLDVRFWWREEVEAWQRGEEWKKGEDELGLDDNLAAMVKQIRALNL